VALPRRAGYAYPIMWDAILGIILSTLCGLIGLMGAGLVGYYLLRLVGVPDANRRAAWWATVAFGIPAAVVGLVYGYWLGSTLVPPV
jgi:hypothetical protein